MRNGDIVRMSSWTHVAPDAHFTFKVRDREEVAVFMLLGREPRDGSTPLDLEAAINRLGWVREK